MKPAKHSDRCGRPVSDDTQPATDRLARFPRISWKQALGGIVSPALRMHRYRTAHNRLLLNALCDRDCGRSRGDSSE